jgi:mono/diheme cytochrome c family protein
MRTTFIAFALLALSPAIAQAECQNAEGDCPNVENGRYLYIAGGCASCHAAPASDQCDDRKIADELAPKGGRCLKTAFGTFNVPNITPDLETGVGAWSTTDFEVAMTDGSSPSNGRYYYPAFPYTSYQRMTRGDLIDLWGFLKTLKPVSAPARAHDVGFPYNVRASLGLWRIFNLNAKPFVPDPAKSNKVNRGAYLVEAVTHCGECHTPRGSLGGKIATQALSGAPMLEGKGYAPNITPHKTGIGDWSEKDIAFALETGITPSGDTMGGAMVAVQRNTARLTKDDREAIAAYLKAIIPIANERSKKR